MVIESSSIFVCLLDFGGSLCDFNLPSLVLVPSHSLYFFSIFASRVCFALHIFKGKVALNIKDDGLG